MTEDPYRHLVAEIQAGREVERNFERLHSLIYQPIHRTFSRWGFPPDECDDFTQETFLRVFKGIGSFRFDSSFATWVHEIAANIYRNELRRLAAGKRAAAGRAKSLDELLANGAKVDPKTLAALVSPLAGAEDETLRQARADELREAVQGLPPQQRQCLLLRLDQGLKYREIAVAMNISIETVKAHLHQAKARLQRELRDPAIIEGIDVEGTDDV